MTIYNEAIRNPTPEASNNVLIDITPDLIEDIPTNLSPEDTVFSILDTVEDKILGEGVDFAIEAFGARIIEMFTGDIMLSIFSRVMVMINEVLF